MISKIMKKLCQLNVVYLVERKFNTICFAFSFYHSPTNKLVGSNSFKFIIFLVHFFNQNLFIPGNDDDCLRLMI